MKRRLRDLMLLLFFTGFCCFSFYTNSLQATSLDFLATNYVEYHFFDQLTDPPVIVGVPNDTTYHNICEVPPGAKLTVIDDVDPETQVSPTDDLSMVDDCLGGTILRIWVAEDSDMNITRDTQVITVLPDTSPPSLAISPGGLDQTVTCDLAFGGAYNSWKNNTQLVVNSLLMDCNDVVSSMNNIPANLASSCDTVVATFTFADGCGNIGNYISTFISIDTVAPVLGNLPSDTLMVSCDSIDMVLAMPVEISVMDCQPGLEALLQNSISTQDADSLLCGSREYQITRIWAASDSCGNTSAFTQVILVTDTKAPTFTVPADTTLSCEVDYLDVSITGTVLDTLDNCGGPITVFFLDDIEMEDGACQNAFTIERTWFVEDVCGNTSVKIQEINLIDTIAPTFIIPADTTVNCGQENDLMITGQPSMLQDNCDTTLVVVLDSDVLIPGSCDNNYTIERLWVLTDDCGNSTSLVQRITVIDTIAPTLSVQASDRVLDCADNLIVAEEFAAWIESHGGAQAADAFSCTPADLLHWDAFIAGTSTPVGAPVIACPASSDTIFIQMVDFIVSDDCGNTDTTSAAFILIDDTAPVFQTCPENQTIGTDPGQCFNTFELPLPQIEEGCAISSNALVQSDAAVITSNALPGQEGQIPVNPITLSFDYSGNLPINASGSAMLAISIENADIGGDTEYFRVLGEDGSLLGRTALAPNNIQCGNSDTLLMLSPAQVDQWAADGVINILLEPNVQTQLPGSFAVNDICDPESTVNASLTLNVQEFVELDLKYRVNVGMLKNFNLMAPQLEELPLGANQITYIVSDCAGNSDTCTYNITVVDQEAPTLDCPDDLNVILPLGECTTLVQLPFPDGIDDNCRATNSVRRTLPMGMDTTAAYLTFTYDPNLNDYLADAKTYTFNNLAANAIESPTLTLNIRGDFNSNGAFVQVIGDSGMPIHTTAVGLTGCGFEAEIDINIPRDTFNVWAADGSVTFQVVPNPIQVPPGVPGDGINPCNPANVNSDGDVDGVSYIFATLSYESITPSYFTQGATTIPLTPMVPPAIAPQHVFNVGETTVSYIVNDAFGNADTCSYSVFVIDNEAPTALCQATIVEINPSDLDGDVVEVDVFDAGSFDNCGIDTMYLQPNTFTCNQAGSSVQATLTVIDLVGNVSTCTMPVGIIAEPPQPSFLPGICGGDTLYLFANPPSAQGGVVYTYRWYNPSGNFFSTAQNPVIPNVQASDSGPYRVEVRSGITACEVEGVVIVTITGLPLTPSIQTNLSVCTDEDIVLSTSSVLNNATYHWYSGLPPNGTLIASTQEPELIIPSPHSEGTRRYYLIMEANGCLSQVSSPVTIQVSSRPIAIITQDDITVCEGESISLGTFVTGVTYDWDGPDGFNSSSQFPTVIAEATLDNAGVYTLVVTRNGCSSLPDFVVVNVLPKPEQPQLVNQSGPICEGETISLLTLPDDATSYHWVHNLIEFTTGTNVFVIPDALESDGGGWYVYTKKFGCDSDPSNTIQVEVNEIPIAMASAEQTDVCENTPIRLLASPNLLGATYEWSGPNSYFSIQQNPVINGADVGDQGVYEVEITTAAGCSNRDTVIIEILESVSIEAVSNNAPTCLDGPTDILLKATLFPADDGSYSYSWTGPLSYFSTDSCAVIPNATAARNGNYQLVVQNADGCLSQPVSTFVNAKDSPQTPNLPVLSQLTQPPFCVGEDITLQINPYSGSGVSYQWVTPAGLIPTSSQVLTIPDATTNDSGTYSVYVIVNGCDSDTSGILNINVNPIPVALAMSNSPVCEGETIQLSTPAFAGATYAWNGPVTSAQANPMIPNANTAIHAGVYTVTTTLNGCVSAPSSVTVAVNDLPTTPVITNTGPLCIEEPGAVLILSVTPGTATPNAQYSWFYGSQLIGVTQSTNFLLSSFGNYGEGSFGFSVEANVNDCISELSDETMAVFNTIPEETAFAGQDATSCSDDPILLSATTPGIGMGAWEQVSGETSGINILNSNAANTQVLGAIGGNVYGFAWTLSNGACENYSSDTVMIQVNTAEASFAGSDIKVCPGDEVMLNSTPPLGGVGYWSQDSVQIDFGVDIEDENDPNTAIFGLLGGNTYAFTWNVLSECGNSSDRVFVTVSEINPFAGPDQTICNDAGVIQLNAEEPSELSPGKWSSPNEDIEFSSINTPITSASNLAVGTNMLIWTLDNAFCGEASRDTVLVFYQENPKASDDQYTISFATEALLEVLENDQLPGNVTLEIVQTPLNGQADVLNNTQVVYKPSSSFVGSDELIYRICSENCETCSEGRVFLIVGEDAQCEVPSVITPNGDNINDLFIVPCLLDQSQYPDNQVIIFNRWGDEVFRSKQPYGNSWDGTFNGEDLPADTYFYIINFGDGTPSLNGFLMIQR
ncbi:MAG TPA: gliding motility-associated C-terminal domain-containing protein [Saprospiraceae bacterium]|nr:gliding motility-associated C-terminal domain-containing protein [Saprospiraceae bacterium]HMQ82995.1 gliding motility-associated C-terminal domain-containing protein [Saprospiraceae bacterium]